MSLASLAVKRPVSMLMAIVCVLVVGGIALSRLPLAFLPEVDVPFIMVEIPYPNSNPTQVEKEIVKPVEEALSTLSGIKKLRATATADSARIELQFDWGEDLDVVRMRVSEKIDQVRSSLPAGVVDVFVFSFSTSDIPVVEGRIAAAGVDLSANYELLESRVVNRLRRIPGVARVDLNGVAPREIFIDLVLDRIKQHGVDVGALVRRLQGASANLVLGQVQQGGLRVTARAVGAFASLDEIGSLPVDEHGLRLSDIAEIRYEEPPITFGRHLDRQAAVAVNVFKESTANTVEVVRAVRAMIAGEISSDPLLQGVKLFVWQDQAEQIVSGLDGLKSSGAVGALLAVLVLYFFLRRLDSTLIVSLSIPFSVVAACGAMYFMGKSLNVLSMMGLMLGVGMLVDNAIVVLESIDRTHRDEPDTRRAALSGAEQVAMAVAASTATSLIVFLPLVVGGRDELTVWLREVGIAISLSLACSLFASLTLIPLVSAHFLKARESRPVPAVTWLEERYVRALSWTLAHRGKAFGLVLVGLLAGVVPFAAGWIDTGMFAATINDRVRLAYEFSDFAYQSSSERAVDQVEEYLFANARRFGIDGVYSYFDENEAMTVLVLAEGRRSDAEVKEMRKTMRGELPRLPGVKLAFDDEMESGGGSTQFAVKLFGQDSEVLRRFAGEVERQVATVPNVEDLRVPALRRARQEIQATLDRGKALRLGLSARDLADVFAFSLGGVRLRRFDAGDREVDTWIALRQVDRTKLEDLAKLPIASRDGVPVLLGDVATFQIVRREQEIERENRRVRVEVAATYEGKEWGKTKETITGMMNAMQMPPGTSWGWDDRVLEQEGQGQQMAINMLLALALVYIVMASLFESLAQPFAILFSIPFAMPGVAWLLAATRTPFNMMAQIGLLILMGIVVNNGIVLLDRMNQLRRAGHSTEQAILLAGRDRLRPVLMTAGTTILGLLPLSIGGSSVGDLLYFPLARTVMGGLLSSTVLTLLVLPYITLGVEAVGRWAQDLWRGSAPSATSGPASSSRCASPAD